MSYHMVWVALAVAGLAGTGCAHRTTSEPATGDYRVRVFNDSPYALSNVHVVTGQGAGSPRALSVTLSQPVEDVAIAQ